MSSSSATVATIGAEEVMALGWRAATEAIREAVRSGLDPDATPPRTFVDLAHGQGILMPAEHAGWFGVKAVTVAPGNPARGLERINGLYLLHDSETLRPVAVLDGVALTTLRTPALSVAGALDVLEHRFGARGGGAPDGDPSEGRATGIRLVLFGSGPQSGGHHAAIAAHVPVGEVTVVARSAESASRTGIAGARALAAEDPAVSDAVAAADVVVAATTARTPVLDGSLVRDGAVVMAVGSHEPEARELDAGLIGRSAVVVESRATAQREAGDVIQAVETGAFDLADLLTYADVVAADPARLDGRPLVVKTSGMAWEDLVVAVAAYERWRAGSPERPGEPGRS